LHIPPSVRSAKQYSYQRLQPIELCESLIELFSERTVNGSFQGDLSMVVFLASR